MVDRVSFYHCYHCNKVFYIKNGFADNCIYCGSTQIELQDSVTRRDVHYNAREKGQKGFYGKKR